MEVAHLYRHGKSLQQATPAITDDGFDVPSLRSQLCNAILVCRNGFVGEESPEKIFLLVRTPPYHDAEEAFEVCGIHHDDHFVRCQLPLRNLNTLQLSLHPLRTASVLLGNLCVSLFAMCELTPNFSRVNMLLLSTLFAARFTLPNLSPVVCAVLLKRA